MSCQRVNRAESRISMSETLDRIRYRLGMDALVGFLNGPRAFSFQVGKTNVTVSGEGLETLDLVRIGADGSPHWSRVWPTPEENPRHAGLQLWMAAYGHQIVGRPAGWFDG